MNSNISLLMGKAFDKLLPVPKTPRVYHPPPPAKPLSWIPHGKIGNIEYELKLEAFASEIRDIDAKRTNRIEYSTRGWCYLLEGLGKIDKDEFSSCQKAINDCRKIGLLPIDFVAEDQDETRRFKGIIEVSEPADLLADVQSDLDRILKNLQIESTDFWAEEKYYLMMCVEKGDILNLFKPICDKYHIPIVSSKGWGPILLRYHIAVLAQKAEAKGLTPVLLLFYDLDPAGIKITDTFRKNLKDCERGTGWSPNKLVIDRFGLNKDDIDRFGLSWIENLKTASGREAHDPAYIQMFGRRKCESNALLKNDETLNAAKEICRTAIEKYYGEDAEIRFAEKETASREALKEILGDPIWESFNDKIEEMIENLESNPRELPSIHRDYEKEVEVLINDKFYGRCPRCGKSFNDLGITSGRTVRCRGCGLPMKLKKGSEEK